ncbi:hypothetical protein ACS0TY_017442 [Phlomoides rotata]
MLKSVGTYNKLIWTLSKHPFMESEPVKADSAYASPSSKEKGQLAELPQGVQVIEPGQVKYANTSSSSKLEETSHQAFKPDKSDQPSTSGVKKGEINLKPQKGPKQLQRPDRKTFTYISEQKTKLELMVNLTEDEISTRRAWEVWGALPDLPMICSIKKDNNLGKQADQDREHPTKNMQHDAC